MQLTVLQRQILALSAAATVPLLIYGSLHAWSDLRDLRQALAHLQQQQAVSAAQRVGQFVQEIENQLRWGTHRPWREGGDSDRTLDALRILKAAPAVTDLSLIDGLGRERALLSRLALNRTGSNRDLSAEPVFTEAMEHGVYYGPVVFRRQTEPFMTLAVAGSPRSHGVVVAEVNLKHVWDIISGQRIGESGRAYVTDGQHRVLAHPDISLVLRRTDLPMHLRQLNHDRVTVPNRLSMSLVGLRGDLVLLETAPVSGPSWRVFVELPEVEANEPMRRAFWRAIIVTVASLLGAIGAALLLARHLVQPIRALERGATRLGTGELSYRLDIRSGDELQALGVAFNQMAQRLEASHFELESRVTERTRELAVANHAMSRFVAAASHDLRQPMHALNLIMGQWRDATEPLIRVQLSARIEAALSGINRLLDDLLDLSRLDAGKVVIHAEAFAASQLMEILATLTAPQAMARGLRLAFLHCDAWIYSDPALLQRIITNLISNGLRYTDTGSVVVACRRRGKLLRIDVLDSGRGIAAEHHAEIFREFFQEGASHGLGLGLTITARLCELLGHRIELRSAPGCGSRFSVYVSLTEPRTASPQAYANPTPDILRGLRVLLLDDDPEVLLLTSELLRRWDCEVISLATLPTEGTKTLELLPDLVLADFHLENETNGIDAVIALRRHFKQPTLPALIVSADTHPDVVSRVAEAGLVLLHKPASPMALRAVMTRLLKDRLTPLTDASPYH